MANNHTFYVPIDCSQLVKCAKFHFNHSIDFLPAGVSCPVGDCTEGPFQNSEILLLHAMIHEELNFVCRFCSEAFRTIELFNKHVGTRHAKQQEYSNLAHHSDIAKLLATRTAALKELTFDIINTPNESKYKDGVDKSMICQYPKAFGLLITESDHVTMMKTCFESTLLEWRMVQCPSSRDGQPCPDEFNNCREMVIHLATHFQMKFFCTTCMYRCATKSNIISHVVDTHFKCISCNRQFLNMESLEAHKTKVNTAISPFINPIEDLTSVNCTMFLPNLAFHHGMSQRISRTAAIGRNHCCADFNQSLLYKVNNPLLSKDVEDIIQRCLKSTIVEDLAVDRKCAATACRTRTNKFRYSTCRQMLVHILLNHSLSVNYTYVCSICASPFRDWNCLRNHLLDHHRSYICEICLLAYGSKANLMSHRCSTGHIAEE